MGILLGTMIFRGLYLYLINKLQQGSSRYKLKSEINEQMLWLKKMWHISIKHYKNTEFTFLSFFSKTELCSWLWNLLQNWLHILDQKQVSTNIKKWNNPCILRNHQGLNLDFNNIRNPTNIWKLRSSILSYQLGKEEKQKRKNS